MEDISKTLLLLGQLFLLIVAVSLSNSLIDSNRLAIYYGDGPTVFKKTLRSEETYASISYLEDYEIRTVHEDNQNVYEAAAANTTRTWLVAVTFSFALFCILLVALTKNSKMKALEITLFIFTALHAWTVVRLTNPPSLKWNRIEVGIPHRSYIKNIILGPRTESFDLTEGKVAFFRASLLGDELIFTGKVTDRAEASAISAVFFEDLQENKLGLGELFAVPEVPLAFSCSKGRSSWEAWVDYVGDSPEETLPCVVVMRENSRARPEVKGWAEETDGWCESRVRVHVKKRRDRGWTCKQF
ncbi:MAG: hypothetical protein GY835_04780 [bacterium]|nr:hypothetical protein [bacterium]